MRGRCSADSNITQDADSDSSHAAVNCRQCLESETCVSAQGPKQLQPVLMGGQWPPVAPNSMPLVHFAVLTSHQQRTRPGPCATSVRLHRSLAVAGSSPPSASVQLVHGLQGCLQLCCLCRPPPLPLESRLQLRLLQAHEHAITNGRQLACQARKCIRRMSPVAST